MVSRPEMSARRDATSHMVVVHGARPVALVVTPTRELAEQIGESFTTYGRGLNLKITVIYGGVGYGKQVEDLRRGVDIVAATPGRLLDLHRGILGHS